MRKLVCSLFVVLLIAGCGIFGSDGDKMFGAWEKVSDSRGEYRGIGSAKFKAKQDTATIDTSFVNSDSQLDLSIEPYDLTPDIDYDFKVIVLDSNKSDQFSLRHWDVKYVSDSTAFDIAKTGHNSRNATDYARLRIRLYNNCSSQSVNEEFVIISYANIDSSFIKVYNIRADGMKEIVNNIVSCRD